MELPRFPTLGFLAADWIEHHCVVTTGFSRGDPFVHQGWQLVCDVNHYRVRDGVEFNPKRPLQGQAFTYRRSVVVGPQKLGKSPWMASVKLFEFAGPCLFGGWAAGGEVYRCSEHGCDCGFEYYYEPGDPMGIHRPTALIQLLASAEDQVSNVYWPLQDMVKMGPLSERLRVLEDRVAGPNGSRLEPVTSSARTRLGNPINDAGADESGVYTARNRLLGVWQTMLRGLAGMDGRAVETTNPWDPMENSAAQQAATLKLPDVFVYYRKPPDKWNYKHVDDRRKIHEFVYADSPWVNLDSIEALAVELLQTDPAQAMRFFGNKLVQGLGSFMPEQLWDSRTDEDSPEPASGTMVCLGLDPSENNDWTAIRAETIDGFRFTPTYGPDSRPTVWNPALWDGRTPHSEVMAAVDELFRRFEVKSFYVDSMPWVTEPDDWETQHPEASVVKWPTNAPTQMHKALVRYLQDLRTGATTHSGCPYAREHALNARKVAKPGDRYILGKPSEHQKIDVLMSDVLAHEAAADARAAGWESRATRRRVLCF